MPTIAEMLKAAEPQTITQALAELGLDEPLERGDHMGKAELPRSIYDDPVSPPSAKPEHPHVHVPSPKRGGMSDREQAEIDHAMAQNGGPKPSEWVDPWAGNRIKAWW